MGEGDEKSSLCAALSESQRTCLRLVAAGYTSKEIARKTGLTPQTVDQYMSRAAASLGVASRREAARMVAEAFDEQFRSSELSAAEVADSPNDQREMPSPDAPEIEQDRSFLRLPPVGGKRHSLNWQARVGGIFQIATAAILALLSLFVLVRGAIHILKL